MKAGIGTPHVEVVISQVGDHVITSTVHPATQEDIDRATELYVQGQCPHNVVVDEAGGMYDFRSCYICGKGLGTV